MTQPARQKQPVPRRTQGAQPVPRAQRRGPLPWRAGLVVVALGAALWQYRQHRALPAAARQHAAAPTAAAAAIPPPQLVSRDDAGRAADAEARSLRLLEIAAGMKTLPLQQRGGATYLTVKIVPYDTGCTHGDLDVMTEDARIRALGDAKYRLSIESLDRRAPWPAVQRLVTTAELKAGLTHTFQLPAIKKPGPAGLFLCDARSGRACDGQDRVHLGELSRLQAQLRGQTAALTAYPRQDKIFYFQLLMAYPDRLLLHDSVQSLDSHIDRVGKVLRQASVNAATPPSPPAVLGTIKSSLRSTGSMPSVVRSGAVDMQLPRRRATGCS